MRTKGEGTIQELPNGKFRGIVKINGKSITGPTVTRRQDALPALRKKIDALREEEEAPAQELPLLICLLERIERMEQGKYSPTTIQTWKATVVKLRGTSLASKVPSEITALDVQRWTESLSGSPRTQKNNQDNIKTVLREHGCKLDIKPPRVEETFKRTLSLDEQNRLLAFLEKAKPDVRVMAIMALRMGLRRSEIAGLRHEHRDDDGVVIKAAVVRSTGQISIKKPKTTKSNAWIPIYEELIDVIGSGKGYVIPGNGKNPISPSTLHDRWRALVKGTEFEDIGIHDLRATYGMTLLENGVDLRTAAEMMRHDPVMLAKIYARSRRDLKREAMKKAFSGSRKGSSESVER